MDYAIDTELWKSAFVSSTIAQLRSDLSILKRDNESLREVAASAVAERDEARRMLELRWRISLNTEDQVSVGLRKFAAEHYMEETTRVGRCDQEIVALRSQLALAESKRKPARHRPGEQVSVGWDPEGE